MARPKIVKEEKKDLTKYERFYTLHKGLAFYVHKLDGSGKRIKKTDAEGNNQLGANYLFNFKQITEARVNDKTKRQMAQEAVFDIDIEMERMGCPDQEMDNPESYDACRDRIIHEILDMKRKTPLLKILTEEEYARYKNPDTYEMKLEMDKKNRLLEERERRIAELEALQPKKDFA